MDYTLSSYAKIQDGLGRWIEIVGILTRALVRDMRSLEGAYT